MNIKPTNRVVISSYDKTITDVENYNRHEKLRMLLIDNGYAYNAIRDNNKIPALVVMLKSDGDIQSQLNRLLNYAIAFGQNDIYYLDSNNHCLKIESDSTETSMGKLEQVNYNEEYLFSQLNLVNNAEVYYGIKSKTECDSFKNDIKKTDVTPSTNS